MVAPLGVPVEEDPAAYHRFPAADRRRDRARRRDARGGQVQRRLAGWIHQLVCLEDRPTIGACHHAAGDPGPGVGSKHIRHLGAHRLGDADLLSRGEHEPVHLPARRLGVVSDRPQHRRSTGGRPSRGGGRVRFRGCSRGATGRTAEGERRRAEGQPGNGSHVRDLQGCGRALGGCARRPALHPPGSPLHPMLDRGVDHRPRPPAGGPGQRLVDTGADVHQSRR